MNLPPLRYCLWQSKGGQGVRGDVGRSTRYGATRGPHNGGASVERGTGSETRGGSRGQARPALTPFKAAGFSDSAQDPCPARVGLRTCS